MRDHILDIRQRFLVPGQAFEAFCKDLSRTSPQVLRRTVQILFLGITLWIGVQFTLFVAQLEKGMTPAISRPPGVEAFLPISSLISLKYWVVSGVFNDIHPSGLVILLIILGTALILKRGFCSWVCPFGLLTEILNRVHAFVFSRRLRPSRWIDHPLRSLKYLLLGFFVWAIFFNMDAADLDHFIHSPYNMVADIKMLYFFANISSFALWTLIILLLLSMLIRNFWCRTLCPYGALLGLLSFFSLFKVRRNEKTCTRCRQCTRVCPADIEVHRASTVRTDECHACLKCVTACPEKDTLFFSISKTRAILKPRIYAAAILLLFLIGTTFARLTGHWETSISNNEYQFHAAHLDLPIYLHNRGQVAPDDKEAWLRMMQALKETPSAPIKK